MDLDRGREREGEGEERGEGGWRGVLGAAGGAGDKGQGEPTMLKNKYNTILIRASPTTP